ncbi:MAG: helix-turn-helix transcriptional regulator [Nitriliruptoraceae bacterium]
MSSPAAAVRSTAPAGRSLTMLLGECRAAIVEHLRRVGEATVAELAAELDISEVATRRHLGVLLDEGLVVARTVPQGRGRPPAHYQLTDAADRLFPHHYDRFASEALDFLADTHGRDGLRSFLRWRLERQVEDLQRVVTAEDLHERLEQLAEALSEAGFDASIGPNGEGFTLTQEHCAIYDVAREHPEVCAYEAAAFSRVLGQDVSLSRRQTLADGSTACVCTIQPRDAMSASAPRSTKPTAAASTGCGVPSTPPEASGDDQ